MAGGAKGSGDDVIVDINVTPLVDIVLVILIIFMVTAKMIAQREMPMELPKASQAASTAAQSIFSVMLLADGTLTIDSKPAPNDEAVYQLAKAEHDKNPELRAVIKADSVVQHGRVVHVLDLMKQAGVNKIAFGVSPGPSATEKKP